MEDEEGIPSNVKGEPLIIDEADKSKKEEETGKGEEVIEVDKCGSAINMDDSNLSSNESIEVLPEATPVGGEEEAAEGGGGVTSVDDDGDLRQEVVEMSEAALGLNAEVGGEEKVVGDAGEALAEAEVTVVELKAEETEGVEEQASAVGFEEQAVLGVEEQPAEEGVEEQPAEKGVEEQPAAGGVEEQPASVEGSEGVMSRGVVMLVPEEVEVEKFDGEVIFTGGGEVQDDATQPAVASEGEDKVMEEEGPGDREEAVVTDVGVGGGVAEPVGAVGDEVVVPEEVLVVDPAEVAKDQDGNAEAVHESVANEKSEDIELRPSTSMDTEIVADEATNNKNTSAHKLDDLQTDGVESANANQDHIIDEGMTEVMTEAKKEMEVEVVSNLETDKASESGCSSPLRNPIVGSETPVVTKEERDELEEVAMKESLEDDAEMKQEKQVEMIKAEVVQDEEEVRVLVEEKNEIKGITEENGSFGKYESDTEKGAEVTLEEGNLVDSESTVSESFADKSGKENEVDDKEEIGTEDVRMEAEAGAEEDGMGMGKVEGEGIGDSDEPRTPQDEEDEAMVAEEETTADTEVETETDVPESGKVAGGKRKRTKNKSPAISKVASKTRKTIGEDVCFICFDGGELVLCDRRGCPKAYHPSCVNRDEAFFRAKGRWNCGWHLCSICEKKAHYMCYTCPFSLCKGCTKDTVILCVRGSKGFCETCMRTVKLIEHNEQGVKNDQVDFDDKNSWEYLFKDYYTDLKSNLSLTTEEIARAKNPWKGLDTSTGKQHKVTSGVQEKSKGKVESSYTPVGTKDDAGVAAHDSNENVETSKRKSRKVKNRLKSRGKAENSSSAAEGISDDDNLVDNDWASKELLEFVMHMKNGDRSVLSQYDVQALLLEYIKRNNLREPRHKSTIICDSRLQNLFGKPRVAHFEMLKLIENHFLIKEDPHTDDVQGSVVDTVAEQMVVDGDANTSTKGIKEKKRKSRKKGDRRGPQSNLDDFAAIDMHNISLIYLRRKLMEDLLEDIESFQDKVVGTFVRIRISGSLQKQDMYRLVQVVGTSEAAVPYKVGKKTTYIMVEILNLNKTEVISIDTISNQDFTEDECKRLRQSIKCGLINRPTVGDILGKATELQIARVNDWLETEIVRLSHLRDRASEKGRKKELRECVEKLQLLKTPEERQRRLEENPEVHADPKMDPSYVSEEDDIEPDDHRREFDTKIGGSGSRAGRGQISPVSDHLPKDLWSSGSRYPSKNWDLDRTLSSKGLLNKGSDNAVHIGELAGETPRNQFRDRGMLESSNLDKFRSAANSETLGWNSPDLPKSESISSVALGSVPSPAMAKLAETTSKINESEKVWRYQDPSGKVQGPFSMAQLRKWSNTGYFPADLKIWRDTEESILLTDVLSGKLRIELAGAATTQQTSPILSANPTNNHLPSLEHGRERQETEKMNTSGHSFNHTVSARGQTAPSFEHPKLSSSERWSQSESLSLPSPTPKLNNAGRTSEGSSLASATSSSGGITVLQSPSEVFPEYLAHSSTPASVLTSSESLRASANDFLRPGTGSGAQQTGLVVAANTPTQSQAVGSSESHSIQMHSNVAASLDTFAPLVQSVNSQNLVVEQGWGSAPSQKVEANPAIPAHAQPQAYGQYGSIPATVQTHPGKFPQGNQPNMQLPAIPVPNPNMPWPAGMNENNTPAPIPRPENSNFGWGVMQGNHNMGWGGAAPVSANVNWAATFQGPPPSSNQNMGWTMPPVNPGVAVQGQMPAGANPGWAAGAGNPAVQGMYTGNVNQGWVPPTGNTTSNVQGPVPPNGWTPAPGNENQGMGGAAPAGSQGTWAPDRNHAGGVLPNQREQGSLGGDSGFGGGRPWGRQSSFGSGGGPGGPLRRFLRHQTPCPYNRGGHCKKGASCDYLHN